MVSFLQSIFSKATNATPVPAVDLHSHLLPGIDDGAKSLEESIELIRMLYDLGVKRIVTTPHVMQDYYPNTSTVIRKKLSEVQLELGKQHINIQIDAAAEYYLDDSFLKTIQSGKEVLTFGSKYLLFETSFQDKPIFLSEAIFEMQSKGFSPILAHPERYHYLESDWELTTRLKESGLFFQLNTISLSGYYSRESKKFAEKLIDHKMIDFIGSDCHGIRHINALKKTINKTGYWNKLMALPLKNNELM